MKSWVLAAGLLAAAAVPAAWATDLDDDLPPPPRGPQGFYKKAPPPGGPPRQFEFDDDEDGPGGPPPSRRYSGPPPPDKRYAEVPPPYGGKCIRSDQVREQLTGLGWNDFHGGQKQGTDLVTLRARRPSGRLFELTLHRCSGQIVDAAPLEPRRFGPYAFKAPYESYGQYEAPPPRRSYEYRQYEYEGPYDNPYRRWHRYRY